MCNQSFLINNIIAINFYYYFLSILLFALSIHFFNINSKVCYLSGCRAQVMGFSLSSVVPTGMSVAATTNLTNHS